MNLVKLKYPMLLISTSVLFILAASHLFANEVERPITLCFNNYPPYVIGDESLSSEPTGIKVDIAHYVFNQLGVELKVVTLPFKRCLNKVEAAELDGTLPLAKNKEREGYMAFSTQANPQSYVFIFKKARFPNGINWEQFNEIKNFSLVLNLGSFVDIEMESAFSSVQPIQRSLNLETLVSMVYGNRADLGAMDLFVANYLIDEMGFTDSIAVSSQSINDRPVYFGFSKKSPVIKLLPRINSILERMHSDGTMSKIIHKKL